MKANIEELQAFTLSADQAVAFSLTQLSRNLSKYLYNT